MFALNHSRKAMESGFSEHLQLFIIGRWQIVARLVGF